MDQKKLDYEIHSRMIGSWSLTIHVPAVLNISLSNYQSPWCCQTSEVKVVDLWYTPDFDGACRIRFDEAISNLEPVVPDVIKEFYNTLECEHVVFLPPEEHINKYYYAEGIWYIDFPYTTDRFFIKCIPAEKTVYICGKPTCLERILTDLFAISGKRLPIHGSAVSINGEATCFLGNSNSGKSSILLKLLEKGYSFIADDMLIIDNGIAYSTESFFSVYANDDESSKSKFDISGTHYKREESAAVTHVYCLTDRFGNPFLQWFPSVARQSFWWLLLLPLNSSLCEQIQELVSDSVSHLNEIMADAVPATLESLQLLFD